MTVYYWLSYKNHSIMYLESDTKLKMKFNQINNKTNSVTVIKHHVGTISK